MLSQEGSLNPFETCPSYAGIAGRPVAERARAMREPELRRRILTEYGADEVGVRKNRIEAFGKMYVLGDPPDYEQPPSRSVAALAAAAGVTPMEVVFDALAAGDGTGMIYLALVNYTDSNLDVVYEMIKSPSSLFGLSDGGAHVGVVCDASFPTFNLTHWVRDRERGSRFPVEFVVHKQSDQNARHMGLLDRGRLEPGLLADVNVIDLPALTLHAPRFAYDLPAGGRRLMQAVDGYVYTIKSGRVTFENGEHTGALPGRVVRGARPAPQAA
jgi:N-acyl-D-aspartate/D-glutamate deacylase